MASPMYRFFYGVGIHTARVLRRSRRRISRLTAPLRRWMLYVWRRYIVLPAHRVRRKLTALFGRLGAGFRFLAREAKHKPLSLFSNFFRLCGGALRHYWEELTALGRLVGPLTAALVLAVTIAGWARSEYCLELTYRGEELGTVDAASVYDAGAELARHRVINEDASFSVDAVPVFTMSLKGDRTPLTDEQVCDAILSTAGDSIVEAVGLYVDGAFVGAMETETEIDSLLKELKESRYNPKNDQERAEFLQDIEKTDGLYPASTVKGTGAMKDRLTAQSAVEKTYTVQAGDTVSSIALMQDMTVSRLRELNGLSKGDEVVMGDTLLLQPSKTFLQVKVVKTVTYTETVDYKTKIVYRDDQDTDFRRVTVQGREGQRTVTAEDTYVDGVKTGRKVVKKTVTKQPVTKIIEQGTKKIPRGQLLWPVPICHNMSRGYYRGHYAIDICNGPVPVYGHDAVAADVGTVIQAATGWNGGYGNMVKIRHDSGLVTVYAHLQSVKVSSGQRVSRGQVIGLIGNSGWSNGPHLHFEVIKNGVKVNPLNYVKR